VGVLKLIILISYFIGILLFHFCLYEQQNEKLNFQSHNKKVQLQKLVVRVLQNKHKYLDCWNALPENVRQSFTLTSLKCQINLFDLSKYLKWSASDIN